MDRLKTKTEQLFDEIYAKRMAFWKNIATNIFEWKGLEQISPDLTSEIVEEQFFENGKSFVYDQNEYGKVWLPVDGAGNWNIYHRPTKFNVKGFGFTEQVNKDIGVLVKNNGLGIPTRELIELEYPNLYMRERLDTSMKEVQKVVGFETNRATRPVIIQSLVTQMREQPDCECDIDTLKEMLVFVRKENGKQEAQEGYHDDLVMARAIATFISKQQGDSNWLKVAPVKKPESRLEKFFSQYDNEEDESEVIVEW